MESELPTWTIRRDDGGGGLFLSWSGPFDLDELLASASALGETDPDEVAPYIVQDFTEMTLDAVAIETLHLLANRVPSRFPRSTSFRSAIVATGVVASTFEQYVEVRDLASARSPQRLPPIRVFPDLDAALAWASGG
ncbi:MAG: hypothetical protein AAGA90_19225 [Actinomycetota bacterium]